MKSKKLIGTLIIFFFAAMLLSHGNVPVEDMDLANTMEAGLAYEWGNDSSFPVELDKFFFLSLALFSLANLFTKRVLSLYEFPDWQFQRNIVLFTPIYYGANYIKIPLRHTY